MTFDQLLERDGHLLLDGHRVVDVAGNVEQLRAWNRRPFISVLGINHAAEEVQWLG